MQGEEDAIAAHLALNLGVVSRNLGDYRAAESLLLQAVALASRLLGNAHPLVVGAQIGLAAVYMDTGRHEQASLLTENALHAFRQRFGDAHPHTRALRETLDGLAGRP